MARRVAIAGSILVAVGVALLAETQPPPQIAPSLPIDRAVNVGLGTLPLLGIVCTWVGGITVGLALVMKITHRLVVAEHPRGLLWAGLGAIVLRALLELGALSVVGPSPTLQLVIVLGAAVIQIVGAVLVAFWLTGRITASDVTKVRGTGWHRAGRPPR